MVGILENGGREFDVISNFQNYDIFIFKNIILKTISWSILIKWNIFHFNTIFAI